MHGTAMRTLGERSASGRSYSRHCEERSDEAIQGPHHCRLRPPGAARAAAPGLLTWGFSRQWLISVFHVVGFLMWRGRGLDGRRAPSSSLETVFSVAGG